MFRKTICALVLFATLTSVASATTSTTPVKVDVDAATFNVTVPVSLPIHVDVNNVVTVATDTVIANNSHGPVTISNVEITAKNGWTISNPVTDKVNHKEFSMTCDVSKSVIEAKGTTPVTYLAKVSPQASEASASVASVTFTIGWDQSSTALQDGDFYEEGNYHYTYQENEDGWFVATRDGSQIRHTQPLEEIQGKPVVSYKYLFHNYTMQELYLDGTWTNANIIDMSYMFFGCAAYEINLSNFYAPKVEITEEMFRNVPSRATLDLSGFNMLNANRTDGMFYWSSITKVYAKTQEDADKLSAARDSPTGLTVVVK